MSLINEALKKARAEAARRAAEEQGIPYPSVPHHRVRRRGGSWLPVALGAGAALAAVALAGFVWWGVSESGTAADTPAAEAAAFRNVPAGAAPASPPGSETTTSDPAPTVRPPAGTDDTATTGPAAAAPAPLAEVSAPQAERPERASDAGEPATTPATIPEPAAEPAEPSDTAPRTPITPTPTDQAPPPPAPAAEATPATTVRGSLPLPDGGRLELSGIAWSASPVAVLNDRVVGQGEVVEGHTVTAIERRTVVLRAPDGAAVRIELD